VLVLREPGVAPNKSVTPRNTNAAQLSTDYS
jgi:hypothetical protein